MKRRGLPLIISDEFNRADGYLGNADTGQAWLTNGSPTTAWNVASNSAKRSSATSSALDVAYIDSGKSNVVVSAIMKIGGYAAQCLVARMGGVSIDDCIRFVFNLNPVGTLSIRKTIASVTTILATANFSYAHGSSYLCSLSCIGNDFIATLDGVQVLSATDDNALKTNTKVGMFIPFASGATYTEDYMDNFTARG